MVVAVLLADADQLAAVHGEDVRHRPEVEVQRRAGGIARAVVLVAGRLANLAPGVVLQQLLLPSGLVRVGRDRQHAVDVPCAAGVVLAGADDQRAGRGVDDRGRPDRPAGRLVPRDAVRPGADLSPHLGTEDGHT